MRVCLLMDQCSRPMSNKISFAQSSLNSSSSEKFFPCPAAGCCRTIVAWNPLLFADTISSLLVPYKYLRVTLRQPQLCPHPLAPGLWCTCRPGAGGSWGCYPRRLPCL